MLTTVSRVFEINQEFGLGKHGLAACVAIMAVTAMLQLDFICELVARKYSRFIIYICIWISFMSSTLICELTDRNAKPILIA